MCPSFADIDYAYQLIEYYGWDDDSYVPDELEAADSWEQWIHYRQTMHNATAQEQ